MIYTIHKGNHTCTPRKKGLIFSRSLSWKVTFDDSCKYFFPKPGPYTEGPQADINKLCGIGYINGDSARFGWRWYKDQLELMAYVHNNGKITIDLSLGSIQPGVEYDLHLGIFKDKYVFNIDGLSTIMHPRSKNQIISFRQNFYFGGNEVAPHDITVNII